MMPSTRTTTIGLAGLAFLALSAGACTAGSPAAIQSPNPTTAAKPTETPRVIFNPVLPPGVSTPVPVSPDAWLAVGRKGIAGLEVIRAGGTDKMFDSLPAGVPIQPDWGRMIATEREGAKTIVDDLVVQPDFGGPSTTVDGAWRLPTIGPDPIPVGVSANGQTIVLIEDGAPATPGKTRFAILAKGVGGPAKVMELKGRFDYDALSPDGRTLYVVEHLDADAGGSYQVRAVDVATGRLQDGVIADKRNISEAMAGYPLAQLRRDDGTVFTLYRGLQHPFIHALNTKEGWALCLDLPATGAASEVAAGDWGLAQSADGGTVYAANATLGLVLEIDPVDYAVKRSASVKPLAGSGIVLAKFGHEESGPIGRRVVVAPDGKTVYAAGAGGILAMDTTDLAVRSTFQKGTAINGLAVTIDGGTLYALLMDGHIVKLDAATGERLATVPGDGYDRLVAVVPW
jgi:outer membrane protein assembly factor BamB